MESAQQAPDQVTSLTSKGTNSGKHLARIERIALQSPRLRRVVRYFVPENIPEQSAARTLVSRSLIAFSVIMLLSVVFGLMSPWHTIGWCFGEGDLMTWISFLMLLTVSFLSHKIWYLRGGGPYLDPSEPHAVWRYLGYGFFFLAFDELLRIHETADRLIHKAAGVDPDGITDHLDDLLIALYGLAGVCCLIRYRKEILKFIGLWRYLFMAALFSILTVVLDFVASARYYWEKVVLAPEKVELTIRILDLFEEVSKIYAEVFFVGAFAGVYFRVAGKRKSKS